MQLELRQLRYFVHLADELSFNRAAQRANISQSSMTEQLQRLEDVLGVRLVERSTRSVGLTVAGELLHREARALLQQVDALVHTLRNAGGSSRQKLRIGYSEMALGSPMPKIVQNFRQRYPQVETTLVAQSSNGAEKALLQGAVDCVFVPDLRAHPALSSVPIGTDLVLACMPESSHLLENEFLKSDDLRDEPLIFPDEGSRFGDRIAGAFNTADVRPNIVARASRAYAILTLVASNTGTGFIPFSLLGLIPKGTATRPFGDPTLIVPLSLVWRNDPPNPVVACFVDIARETIAGHGAARTEMLTEIGCRTSVDQH
jgi:DNA-binding transcriptional LysR family regulator